MSGPIKQRQALHRQLQDNEFRIQLLEDQIRATQKMASLGTMISVVAHEFNNILVPMINYSELALDNPDDTDLMRKALTKTVEHGNRASAMIKSMLGLVRAQDNKKETVALSEIVDECFQCLTRDLSKDRIRIIREIPEGLSVHVIPSQLLQVLFNLVINARQAMLERGGQLKITARQDDQLATAIEVSDTGCGIEPDIIDRIFEPFVSTKTNADNPANKGTGLGLMVCREIIESHLGQITVQSQPHQGATFTILLPPLPNGE